MLEKPDFRALASRRSCNLYSQAQRTGQSTYCKSCRLRGAKEAAGCVRDFLGKVEEFRELRKFAKEMGPGFWKGNIHQMQTLIFVLIYALSSCSGVPQASHCASSYALFNLVFPQVRLRQLGKELSKIFLDKEVFSIQSILHLAIDK